MELLFLDGEEAVIQWQGDDRTYGSRHYVETGRTTVLCRSLRAMIASWTWWPTAIRG
mgnify:CR=1 FL=1